MDRILPLKMQVLKLEWLRFRNLKEGTLVPDAGMNVICGENAQGKTNLIEAIWLFSGAKSFRTNKDSSFVMQNFDSAKTKLHFFSEGIEKEAELQFLEKRKAFLNGKPLQNPSKLAGIFTAVVFSPTDLSLIKGAPEERRKFLDLAIGQLYPNYIELLHRYKRALVQRNKILKDYKYDASLSVLMDVFEQELSEVGSKIIEKRRQFLKEFEIYLPNLYEELSAGREKLKFSYQSSVNLEKYSEQLRESRKEDSILGSTSIGPHRDDLNFTINGMSARVYGSQGQQRSVALSLKLAQAELIFQKTGEYPVCLLDDVMSELDPLRQNYILNHIGKHQCFLTCCDPANIAGLKEGKIIRVQNGEVF